MQQHVLPRLLSRELRDLSTLVMIALLALTLLQPLALASHTVAWPTNAPVSSDAPSLAAQFETLFPTLKPDLAVRAEFQKVTHPLDGQALDGFVPSTDPVPPAGLQAAEQQAWLAMAHRSTLGAGALALFFPARYADPFVVEGQGMQIRLRALDAQVALAQVEDGTLAYRGVYRATDSLHLASAGQSKEFLLLHSAAAPTRFRYALEAGARTMVTLEAGTVRIAAAQGGSVQIPAPWLVDASGRRNATAVRWELGAASGGARILTLLLDPAGLAYPLAIDPTWSTTSSMSGARYNHTATLLPSGKVLVAGGSDGSSILSSAELYDPATGAWSSTGALTTARDNHTATLLPSGKVLVAGGQGNSGSLSSAELYDPATGSWSSTGALATARAFHTATLLPNGKVLVAGGQGSGSLSSAELYDPAIGAWSSTGALATARDNHTATLLPNGTVLVAGGWGSSSTLSSAELYDTATGSWSSTGSLATARYNHTATLLPNGKVLLAGGSGASSILSSAELYDTATGIWSSTGALATARDNHTATLLPNGTVLIAGGSSLSSAELYDPAIGSWSSTGALASARRYHTATLLPNGTVLVAGGQGSNSLSSAELYDPATGSWSSTGSLATARYNHTATLLPSGKVLVAGGQGSSGNSLSSAELYDPATGSWSSTGSLATARYLHTATLLPNGKVLVAGGRGNSGNSLSSAELYDPAIGSWSSTGSLATARIHHTATLLPNGKVLVAGGYNGSNSLRSAELYDPATGAWSSTGALATTRAYHTATLLPNGKVLVAGGYDGNSMSSAELYDPAIGSWSSTGALATVRDTHTATLLPNGTVLLVGGLGGSGSLSNAELYDPAIGSWSSTGALASARYNHTATLLPSGKVLIAGGQGGVSSLSSAELYDPATGAWSSTGALASARRSHTATLLPNGTVLVAGGYNSGNSLRSAELYDTGSGFLPAWRPTITTAPALQGSGSLTLAGSGFRGISEASSGSTNNSATGYPLVQLRTLDGSLTRWLSPDPAAGWSDTSFTSQLLGAFPDGYALVTVFTSGIPSQSAILQVDTTAPVAPVFTGITTDSGVQTSGVTTDSTVRLNGAAEAGSTVTLTRIGQGVIGTATADSNGAWSFDYTGTSLALGSYRFSATATDAASNTSASSAEFVVMVRAPIPMVWYVNDDASGSNDGSSWPNAYTSLQSALAAAIGGDQIWVAAGTYIPPTGSDRSASFMLKNGVPVYGGFAGSETQLGQRDWASNVTTLSGDIGTVGAASDNSYHVVIGASGATLDGFTISGGNANSSTPNDDGGGIHNDAANPTLSNLILSGNQAVDGGAGIYNNASSPTLTNVTISNNQAAYGGGVYNDNASNAVLTHVIVSGNSASISGGGIFNQGNSSPTLTSVLISGNLASQGGGIYNNTSSSTLTNVTIAGNRAGIQGGAIYNNGGDSPIRNSIIWGNRAGTSVSALSIAAGTPVVSYSLVEGGYSGTGNLSSDPQFSSPIAATSVPTTTGDYRLQITSPAIDAGDNSVVAVATDLDDKPRQVDQPSVADTGSGTAPIVDMGAYEMPGVAISSITRLSPATNPTSAASVTFQVIFAESVSGVDASDFALTLVSGNTAGASVTAVSGSGTTWQVTANLGGGAGVMRLDTSGSAFVTTSTGLLMSIQPFTSGETYIFDTTAPAAPSITGITTDRGVQTSGTTDDPTINLNGTAEAGGTVTLSRADSGVIGTTSANGAGVWSFDYTGTSLPFGSYTFSATARDAAGNISAASNSFIVTVVNFLGRVPELMYYRFDTAGTSVANQASAPVGSNPAPILNQTIGNTGQFGSALVGTGAGSDAAYVDTGWAPTLGTSSWTISFWTSNVPASSTAFYFFGDANSKSLRAFTNGVAGFGNVMLRGDGMANVLVTGAATSQPNVVHFVYDATVPEIRAYKNGVLVTTVPQPALTITGAGPFKVGGYGTNTGLAAGQLFDEFRLYNRALSAEEVSATWNHPLQAISLTTSVEPTAARPGDPVTYTISFANAAEMIANNLLITDTLSPGITNTTVTSSGVALTQLPGSRYVWSAPSLAVYSGGVITITGTLASPLASGLLTNTVLLSTTEARQTAEAALTIENLAPVAAAGADQLVDTNQVVTLNGSGSSDANGDSLTYGWTQTGGPAVQLNDATASSPTFTTPASDTVLTFTLMVTDSFGLAAPTADQVVVTVYQGCGPIAFPYTVPAGDSAALSQAITCANLFPDANVIALTKSTYSFTSGDSTNSDSALPRITTPITITGNGATLERAEAAPDFRLLDIESGAVILDHLILTGGRGGNGGGIRNLGDLTLTHSTVIGNTGDNGGGIHNEGNLMLSNSTLAGNRATGSGAGGGLSTTNTATVINSTISGNSAPNGGGAAVSSGSATMTNVTVAGNSADGAGGGVLLDTGTLTVRNSIIWGNRVGAAANSIATTSGVPAVSYSLVEGGTSGTGNLSSDPHFISAVAAANAPTSAGNYQLQGSSPAIDAGDNSVVASTTDLAGNPRQVDLPGVTDTGSGSAPIVDMGAYERKYLSSIYVNQAAIGTNDGSSWANAFTSLQSALAAADSGIQIWVAAGTYTPTTGSDRSASFMLKNGVAVYGGFAGTETAIGQRDWASNVATLSGDLNDDDGPNFANNGENSYHVVVGANGATLDGFTISGGNADSGALGPKGGGIYNSSTSPTLRNLIVRANQAWDGGGIYNSSSSPTLINVTVSDNTATVYGGGIYLFDGGSPTLTNITLSGNHSELGGGIAVAGGSATLTDVTVSGNTATDYGGGIYLFDGGSPTLTNITLSDNHSELGGGIAVVGGSATLSNVTVSANNASGGGGVHTSGSTVSFTNTTISGNRATDSQGDGGGAILAVAGTLTFTNVTITGNSTSSDGSSGNGAGGISALSDASVTLTNTIVAGNTSSAGKPDLSGTFVSGGHNLIGTTTGSSGITNGTSGDLAAPSAVVLDPKLAALANNGGPTQTHALLSGSPAINAGDNATCPTTDQRGASRVAACDIGAYEFGASIAINQPPTLDQPTNLTILEDAGVQTVSLTGIGAGAGDAEQLVIITATSSNPSLIPNPTVSYTNSDTTASLSFRPIADANGTATVTLTMQDSGGTNGGGVDMLMRSFTVQISAVNDAPDFTAGSNQTVQSNTGAVKVSGWASGFSPGPADEASQMLLGYTVVSNSAPELFAVAPAIDSSGALTYTPKPGASGTATLSVVVRDSGGTASGGVDTSTVRTFTITVGGSYRVYLPLALR